MPTLTTCKGLYTFSNQLTIPEGALLQADNVNVDRDNIIEPRRGFFEYGDIVTSSGYPTQLFSYKNTLLRHTSNDKLEYDNGSGTFTQFNGDYSELESGYRLKSFEANSNFYFTSSHGIQKISATNSSEFTTDVNYITKAGVPKALDLRASMVINEFGFLPARSKCAYRIVWGYKDVNDVLVLGAPSQREIAVNISEAREYKQMTRIYIPFIPTTQQLFLINSGLNEEKYFVWYDTSGTDEVPITNNTIGRIGVKVDITGAASTDEVATLTANALTNINTSPFTVTITSSSVYIECNKAGETDPTTDISTGNFYFEIVEGRIIDGLYSNVDLEFTIPQEIKDDVHFYQIYRTGYITETDQIPLDELDPGDDMNLVYEANVTSTDISSGIINYQDITPDLLRVGGSPLYTNANSGEGILQANERPPIAYDMALFKNNAFYANTKRSHFKTLDLIGLNNIVSNEYGITFFNDITSKTYAFQGTKQITKIKPDSADNTNNGGYFILYSANGVTKYKFWFSPTSEIGIIITPAPEPIVSDAISIKIEYDITYTQNQMAELIKNKINSVVDFTATLEDDVGDKVVVIENVENGPSTEAYFPNSIEVTGTGQILNSTKTVLDGTNTLFGTEFNKNNFVKLSIDSDINYIKISNISSNTSLSFPTDYTGTLDTSSNISKLLSPGISKWVVNTTTTGTGEDVLNKKFLLSVNPSRAIALADTAKSLIKVINNDKNGLVYGYYVSGIDDISGKMYFETRNVYDPKFYIAIEEFIEGSTSISNDFIPELPQYFDITTDDDKIVYSDNEVAPNRIYVSKTGKYEAVPLLNYVDIGSKDQPIYRVIASRDNIFVLKTEGVYIINGTSFGNLNVRLLDNSTQIIAPDSANILNNKIYFLSSQGIVTVSDTGVSIISRPIENKILAVTNVDYNYKYTSFGVGYETDRTYTLWLPTKISDDVATQSYRFNTFTNTWTRWTKSNTCGLINVDNKLYLGNKDGYVEKERKNNNRTDYSDREFSISPIFINSKTITFSDLSELDVGDILYQKQYLTISRFNKLLQLLDSEINFSGTYSTLEAVAGDSMKDKLTSLCVKLSTDDVLVYTSSDDNDPLVLQSDFNSIISNLQNAGSNSIYKTQYIPITTYNEYESLITDLTVANNIATVQDEMPFTLSDFTVFKGFESIVQWAPQDFGDASLFKQISESTVLFEQMNFRSGKLAFCTDLFKEFTEVPFNGLGTGAFGEFIFGNHTFGGDGNEYPIRTYVPRNNQRCRYLNVKFIHINAREKFAIQGMSLKMRQYSTKAYK